VEDWTTKVAAAPLNVVRKMKSMKELEDDAKNVVSR